MATSLLKYHQSQIEAVARVLKIDATTRLPWDELRSLLDGVGDKVLLTAGIADFWLDLSKSEGPRRRGVKDPPSPFFTNARSQVATKANIASWDEAWRRRLAAEALAGARTERAQDLKDELIYSPSPWMIETINGHDVLIGHMAWLPANSADDFDPAHLDVVWLRPDQALRLPWKDRKAAQLWLAIVERCHRQEEADLANARLELDTPDVAR